MLFVLIDRSLFMYTKRKNFISLRFVILCTFLLSLSYSFSNEREADEDQLIKAIGSLTFHIKECKEELESSLTPLEKNSSRESFSFSEEEVTALWNRIAHDIYLQDLLPFSLQEEQSFQEAHEKYYTAKTLILSQEQTLAKELLEQSFQLICPLREQTIDKIIPPRSLHLSINKKHLLRQQTSSSFENSKIISSKIKKRMRPYVIPSTHPMKRTLDDIFYASRATLNEYNFAQAGFITKYSQPRSFIKVASHPLLPGYLVKVNLDSELRQKQDKPSWKWLVQRCEGAEKVRDIIDYKKIKHFTVAQKWLYPLPDNPSPPPSSQYTRHLAILLVTDMNLVAEKQNFSAWKHYITKEHLDELYTIISYAKGSSYRPDNIWYTLTGEFAFIDTEYPGRGPDYKSIGGYLSANMKEYWNKLVKRGGY
jgi:hypothetical protein